MDARGARALAEDLVGRTVLAGPVRTLLNVADPVKDAPDDTDLARDVDLDAIRRVVAAALPG